MSSRRKRRKKNDGLTSKVVGLKIIRDDEGTYLPFCDYHQHRGYVLRTYVCEKRECFHYHKLYITKENQEYDKSKRSETGGE